MKQIKPISDIAAIQNAAIENLLSTLDADLRQEAREDGVDMNAVANKVRASMREVAASTLRKQLAQNKIKSTPQKSPIQPHSFIRPSIERIKEIVSGAFANDQRLGLAFREGKRQSDADWVSLYDDLISIGAIEVNHNEF